MWDNHWMLNKFASGLFTIVVLAAVFTISPSVLNLPVFALKKVSVTSVSRVDEEFKYITREQINNLIRSEVTGSFFTVDLDAISNAFKKLSWVRTVSVRRHWPSSLEVKLEEHVALARWGNSALVNIYGEVFNAMTDKRLPEFSGPEESSHEVSQRYAVFRKLLQPLHQNITHVYFSPRHAWRVHIDSGTVLELGREQVETRLGLYVSVHNHIASQFKKQVAYVDLRYPNGISVRVLESNRQKFREPSVKNEG